MRLYAETPARRSRQVMGDLVVVLWVALWVAVGRAVHAAVSRLAEPGRALEDAGRTLEDGLRDAATGIARLPVVGGDLRAPFDVAGDAAGTLARAGADAQTAVGRAALLAGLAVAVWPVVLGVGGWAVHRWRWARRSAAVDRVRSAPGGADLLALRALAAAPVSRLAAVGPDPAGSWRRGDPAAVAALAALILRDVGLRGVGVQGAGVQGAEPRPLPGEQGPRPSGPAGGAG